MRFNIERTEKLLLPNFIYLNFFKSERVSERIQGLLHGYRHLGERDAIQLKIFEVTLVIVRNRPIG